ncbi:MAG TPA: SpoIIE family protein phosphatase [Kofleriaceae bacterium]|nr:SpoIIE family protein phosphatase [Kofleriaceae bacterium]
MFDLRWSWLCVPYLLCAAALLAVGVVAGLVRGDRVMRLGVIGAATAGLPWAIGSALAICTDDPGLAVRLLRLGAGPVSLIGPNLLLVLLGISGQLERHRWVVAASAAVGAALLGLCWGTDWTVPGVHHLTSGVFYLTGGPLTDIHIGQLAMWIAVGLVIARRSMMRGERRRMLRVLVIALVLAAIAATDILLVHGVVGVYPVGWLPAMITSGIALYLELYTDLLRPSGIDRGALFELGGLAATAVLVAVVAAVLRGAAAVEVAAFASAVWMVVTAIQWWLARRRPPPRVFGERAIERFTAGLTEIEDDRPVGAWLAELWRRVEVAVRATWRAEPAGLVDVATGAVADIDREVAAWLVAHAEPLAAADLATMRLGPIRPRVEAWVASRGATLLVPLVDRGALVGLVEADHVAALREAERGLVAQSARAAARALTYVNLARAAAREGATAREVEVAEAMRLQASARHDDELGPWRVAAEYRSAPRTTGAAWSANLTDDGRLAILVTEGQAHGVPAALATAALTGAFVAATTAAAPTLPELIDALRASADDVLRGGEPIAAFIALLDAAAGTIAWGCAGHAGALVVTPGAGDAAAEVALGGAGARLGDAHGDLQRGEAALAADQLLVIASSGVYGGAPAWRGVLRDPAALGPRLAARLVDAAAAGGQPGEDLLAVVVRQRGDRRSARLPVQREP